METQVQIKIVGCDCGKITGTKCGRHGPKDETVVLEYMPRCLRASHDAARNPGVYPCNGAERIRVEEACAEAILEAEGRWASVVS